MNRRSIENANNMNSADNNFRREIITNGENLSKPPSVSTELVSVTTVAENNINNSLNNKPDKNDDSVDDFNIDDVNMMTRTNVDKLNKKNDRTDAKRKSNKPINYAAKKTVAQGLIDIALLTSNANQLKSLVENQTLGVSVYFIIALISVSLLLQVGVGVTLIFMGRFDSKGKDKAAAARVNKYIMTGVFLITLINIFIAVFTPTAANNNNSPAPTTARSITAVPS